VIELQPRTISIEDTHDANVDLVIAMIGYSCRLSETLGFVIHRPRTDGIYIPPIAFFLRMFMRIAITLRGGRQKKYRSVFTRQIKRIKHTQRSNLERLDAVLHVIHRTGGRGEIEDVIYRTTIIWLGDVELPKLKSRFVLEMSDVAHS